MPTPLIILGQNPRAAAGSARLAGYEPWVVTTRPTVDLPDIATVRHCPAERYPAAVLGMIDDAPVAAPILLAGDMENYLDVVQAVSFEHKLLGCTVDAMRHIRDPLTLPSLPAIEGIRSCHTRTRASLAQRLARLVFGAWGGRKYLLKPRRSYLGHGIQWWTPGAAGQRIGHDRYLQQYIRGTPYTAVFFADGWSARLLGVTEILVGEPAFHAQGFQVVGQLGPVQLAEQARTALSHLSVQLTQRFDMRGLFGVDLIMDHRGTLWPVEVNPRYVDAIELLERASNVPLLAPTGPGPLPAAPRTLGRATLFASHDLAGPPDLDSLPSDQVADRPLPNKPIAAGEPVVTLFAAGASRDACERQLRERATALAATC
ncbi:ATP-grasp domain-containing protein [Phycisphaerales bacterium AB-hyl4]|uniref:ATP-grasp domain-containing protein n=1 Tax=Natronomicrosphaera hydrolytica TaxID=3242702 RepID=A0ABV4U9W5_9BACT